MRRPYVKPAAVTVKGADLDRWHWRFMSAGDPFPSMMGRAPYLFYSPFPEGAKFARHETSTLMLLPEGTVVVRGKNKGTFVGAGETRLLEKRR